jgi:putative flippase GtrA
VIREKSLANRLRQYFQNREVRYLVVGGVNTVVGFSAFTIFIGFLGYERYLLSLAFSHIFATSFAFLLYRRVVFKVRGKWVLDFVRFQLVYLAALLANIPLLYLCVQVLRLNPLAAQAVCVILVVVSSYFGHRFFSFRRKDLEQKI